eukprot:452738-Rhodomonas_salina.2
MGGADGGGEPPFPLTVPSFVKAMLTCVVTQMRELLSPAMEEAILVSFELPCTKVLVRFAPALKQRRVWRW